MQKKIGLILENNKVLPDHYILRLRLPELAGRCLPGQFLQIYLSEGYDPLLPRPFSFLAADKKDLWVLYRVIGKATAILSKKKKGEGLQVLGPLGNSFSLDMAKPTGPGPLGCIQPKRDTLESERKAANVSLLGPQRTRSGSVVLVGGGTGIPPLHHFVCELLNKKAMSKEQILVFLGARSKQHLLCEKNFKTLGVHLILSTEDGSKGAKGLVTMGLEDLFIKEGSKEVRVFSCGPIPMMSAVAALCRKYEIPCQVSMEVMMACGFGACLGCAVKLRQKAEGRRRKVEGQGYVMACKDGPIFNAEQIAWE